jgi:diacylglycerol kinase
MPTFKNKNIFCATAHAINGMKELLKERSARREIVILFLAVAIWCYDFNIHTSVIVILSIILLAVESLNTAIEYLCDYLQIEFHESIRRIKDLGATAVFLVITSIIFTVISYIISKTNFLG